MTKELAHHVEQNLAVIDVWIETNQELQPDNDILKPMVKEFLLEFPSVNVNGSCRECLIDMLRWAKGELKKITAKSTEPKKEKGGK